MPEFGIKMTALFRTFDCHPLRVDCRCIFPRSPVSVRCFTCPPPALDRPLGPHFDEIPLRISGEAGDRAGVAALIEGLCGSGAGSGSGSGAGAGAGSGELSGAVDCCGFGCGCGCLMLWLWLLMCRCSHVDARMDSADAGLYIECVLGYVRQWQWQWRWQCRWQWGVEWQCGLLWLDAVAFGC
jgi:hypothetical protein